MEIILKHDVIGLGYKYDTVSVKPGYGRNFLIPKGHAIIANKSNRKMVDENIRQSAHKAEKIKNDAQELAKSIKALTIEIKTKAGKSDKIFGSITAHQIAEIFKENNFNIDRRKISFTSEIKKLGEYEAIVDLHKELTVKIAFSVIAE